MAKAAYVWDGSQFVSLNVPIGAPPNAVVAYGSTSPSNIQTGTIWYDVNNGVLKVWSGSSWQTPQPINPINRLSDIVTTNDTITLRAVSVGPVTINSEITVTISSGAVWSII